MDLISKISERDTQDRHKQLLVKELNSSKEASLQDMEAKEDQEYMAALLQRARKKYFS